MVSLGNAWNTAMVVSVMSGISVNFRFLLSIRGANEEAIGVSDGLLGS
jgi:hypothetical protein